MASTDTHQATIVRTERGLVIAGTRITLYSLLDYLQADWPPDLVRQWLNLTDDQMAAALDYIQCHHHEVEQEFELVKRMAEDNRRYWQERNRARLASIEAKPPPPGQEALRARLRARKALLGME